MQATDSTSFGAGLFSMLKKMVCLLLGVAAASALPIDAAVEGDTNPTVRGTTFAPVPRPDDIDLDKKSTCTDGAAACRKCQPWQKRVRWTWRDMCVVTFPSAAPVDAN